MLLSKKELMIHDEPHLVLKDAAALLAYEPVLEQLSVREKRVLAEKIIAVEEALPLPLFSEWEQDGFFPEEDAFIDILYRAYRLRQELRLLLASEIPYENLLKSPQLIDLAHEFQYATAALMTPRINDFVQCLALTTPKKQFSAVAQRISINFHFCQHLSADLGSAFSLYHAIEQVLWGEKPYEFFVNPQCHTGLYRKFPRLLEYALSHPEQEKIIERLAATPEAYRSRVLDHMAQLFPCSVLFEQTRRCFRPFYPERLSIFSRPASPDEESSAVTPPPFSSGFSFHK